MNAPGVNDADLRAMEDLDLARTVRLSPAYQDPITAALCDRLERAVEYAEELEANARTASEVADEETFKQEARIAELETTIADLKRQLENKT